MEDRKTNHHKHKKSDKPTSEHQRLIGFLRNHGIEYAYVRISESGNSVYHFTIKAGNSTCIDIATANGKITHEAINSNIDFNNTIDKLYALTVRHVEGYKEFKYQYGANAYDKDTSISESLGITPIRKCNVYDTTVLVMK
jgi:hypothetical protein